MKALMDYVCSEMEELERKASKDGKLSMAEMQYLDTLAHTKKNLLKSDEMSGEEGYSGMMYPRYYGDDRMDGSSYRDGHSYARGRMGNVRRDSMGRYSRGGHYGGYSMASDEMISELRDLMNDAPDEHTRKEFEKFISKIESM
nr:hypothetical protein [Clostridia bacterium]